MDDAAPLRSAHATAQAKYRSKNEEAERQKARNRYEMPTRPEQAVPPLQAISGPRTNSRNSENIWIHWFLDVDDDKPGALQEWEEFLQTNPSTLDLMPFDQHFVEEIWAERDFCFPEWREELADYRDFVMETTAEERGERLRRARAEMVALNLLGPRFILAPGGF
ncbi:hypothetical protein DFH07DRAFT_971920 [Mycena maculata]|uniref:Uncharacterized protein n=1 Tax=Mycena maculata TaxID=230809 RepID=A0AAD7ML16_9AGAR|nr:hypothetical protein DFH07DRAFT_971920 [Mycena maculata]